MSSTDLHSSGDEPPAIRNLKRLDRYVVSAPIMIIVVSQLLWPVLGAIPAYGVFPLWRVTVSAVASVLLAVADLIMVRWALRVVRSGEYGIRRGRLIPWAALVIPLIALTATAPMAGPVEQTSAVPLIVALSVATAWASVSLAYSMLVAGVGALILATVNVLITAISTAFAADLDVAAGLTLGIMIGVTRSFWIVFLTAAVWSSGWMLRVVMELYRSRKIAAELAIAEERLRFGRDLHDVFGRTLATVALKSELAEELARRGRVEQAGREMAAVRQLAEDTGREVRGLVRGYREADLDRELAGAQTLLDSAGIHCQVSGPVLESGSLDKAQTTALAWVLREAITNIIRHSSATSVMIDFSGADPVTMTIMNDGNVRSARTEPGTGTGLPSMAARVSKVGGSFQHRQTDDRFILTATVPTGSPVGEGEPSR